MSRYTDAELLAIVDGKAAAPPAPQAAPADDGDGFARRLAATKVKKICLKGGSCAATASERLRQVGVDVPPGTNLTGSLATHLTRRGWQRYPIRDGSEIQPGDALFYKDRTNTTTGGGPNGLPDHVGFAVGRAGGGRVPFLDQRGQSRTHLSNLDFGLRRLRATLPTTPRRLSDAELLAIVDGAGPGEAPTPTPAGGKSAPLTAEQRARWAPYAAYEEQTRGERLPAPAAPRGAAPTSSPGGSTASRKGSTAPLTAEQRARWAPYAAYEEQTRGERLPAPVPVAPEVARRRAQAANVPTMPAGPVEPEVARRRAQAANAPTMPSTPARYPVQHRPTPRQPVIEGQTVPEERVTGPTIWNDALRHPQRPRNFGEQVGRGLQGFVSPQSVTVEDETLEGFRNLQRQGRAVLSPEIKSPTEQRKVERVLRVLDGYLGELAAFDQARFQQVPAQPQPLAGYESEFQQRNREWMEARDAYRRDVIARYDLEQALAYVRAQGFTLTPLTEQAIRSQMAWQAHRYGEGAKRMGALAADAGVQLASIVGGMGAERLLAPFASQAAAAIAPRLPAPVRAAAASPLGQAAGRVLSPVRAGGNYAGGAIQQGLMDVGDPRLTPAQRLQRANQGGLAGVAGGIGFGVAGELLGVGARVVGRTPTGQDLGGGEVLDARPDPVRPGRNRYTVRWDDGRTTEGVPEERIRPTQPVETRFTPQTGQGARSSMPAFPGVEPPPPPQVRGSGPDVIREPYQPGNPFAERALRARALANQLNQPTAHEEAMRNAFPVGGGFARGSERARGRSIDASVSRAVRAVKAAQEADRLEALAAAFDRGEINAQGRRSITPASQARRDKAARQRRSSEERIAAARAMRGNKEPWEVTRDVWADQSGQLGGRGRRLVENDHREAVERALEAGQPVPEEVMADYPDLARPVSGGQRPPTPTAGTGDLQMGSGGGQGALEFAAPARRLVTPPQAGTRWTAQGYHSTPSEPFERFDSARIGSATDDGDLGAGFYMSTDPNVRSKGQRLVAGAITLENPLMVSYPKWGANKSELVSNALGLETPLRGRALTGALQAKGYDGVVLDYTPVGYRHQEVVALSAEQIGQLKEIKLGAELPAGAPLHHGAGRIGIDPLPPLPAGAKGRPGAGTKAAILDLGRSLDRPIQRGRVRRGALGFYRPSDTRTVIRFEGDADTAAHEASHAIDHLFGLSQTTQLDHELAQFWPHGSPMPTIEGQRAEGVAEFVRAWMFNPKAAEAAAPGLTAWMKQRVPSKTLGSLRNFGDHIRRWDALSDVEKAKANVRFDMAAKDPVRQRSQEWWAGKGYSFETRGRDRFMAAAIDDLYPLMRAIETAKEWTGRAPAPSQDPAILARLYAGEGVKIRNVIEQGLVDVDGNRVAGTEGGFASLFRAFRPEHFDEDLQDASAWMLSQRVVEKGDQLQAAADAKVAVYRRRLEDQQLAKIEAEYQEIMDRVTQDVRESVIAKEAEREGRLRERYQARIDKVPAGPDRDAKVQALQRQRDVQIAAQKLAGAKEAAIKKATGRQIAAIPRSDPDRGKKIAAIRKKAEADIEAARVAALATDKNRIRTAARRRMEREDARHQASADRRTVRVKTGALKTINDRVARRARALQTAVELQRGRYSGAGGGIYSDYQVHQRALQEIAADPERLARVTEAAAAYRRWADANIQYLVDAGRLSSEAAQAMREANTQYVDMHRVMDEAGIEAVDVAGNALGQAAEPIRRWHGSTREIENPYVSLMKATASILREADRNRVLLAFRELLITDNWLGDDAVPLAQIGTRMKSAAPKGPQGAAEPHSLVIWVEGKPERWRFEPGVFQALKGWSESSGIAEVLMPQATLAGLTRTLITSDPGFAVRNLIRDTVSRSVVSRTGSRTFAGLRQLRPPQHVIDAFETAGGGQAGWYARSPEAYHRALADVAAELRRDPRHIVVESQEQLRRIGQRYRGMLERGEMANRLAEFEAARKHAKEQLGYSDRDADLYAALEARDLMDFARAGSLVRQINRIIPFTNAAVQGLNRTWRSVKSPAGRRVVAANFAVKVLAPTLMAYAWNATRGQNHLEEYREIPSYKRDLFWNFKVGPNLWLSIPKGYDVGVWSGYAERLIDGALGNKEALAPHSIGKSLDRTLVPVEPTDAIVSGGGIGEAIINRDTFRNRNVVPPWEEGLELARRKGTAEASRLGQWIQRLVQVDARKVDHVIHQTGGGLGRNLTRMSDLGRADKPMRTADWLNPMTGLFGESPGGNAESVQRAMDLAAAKGKLQDDAVRELAARRKAWRLAPDDRAREVAARRLREQARFVLQRAAGW